jgi:hypothetical protein
MEWKMRLKLTLVVILLMPFVPASGFGWTAPSGIPTPAWPSGGIDQARPAQPSPWSSEQAGWYYVDSAGGCSDNRAYGYPGASRCSLPASPAAGSKVVINGTVTGLKTISANGSSGSEIWYMGYNTSSRPTLSSEWNITGSYLIFDNLSWVFNSQDGVNFAGHHILIRSSNVANSYDTSNGSAIGWFGSNIIFYRSSVSQSGNWQYAGTGDIDRHGIKFESGAADAWVVDSNFYHCHGDGIQVGDQNNAASQINRIYLGRNISYENYQSCFWVKNATDVIMSENTCRDISYPPQGASYSSGQAIGGQYDPKYVWFLFNKIYNVKSGIYVVGGSNNNGGPWYAIGNLIYNVSSPSVACNNYDAGGILYRNAGGMTAIFNTFYNVDMFIADPNSSGLIVRNNIFSTQATGGCPAMSVDTSFTHDYNLFSASGYDPSNEPNRKIEVASSTFVNAPTDFNIKSTSLAKDNGNPTVEPAFAAFQSRYGIDIRKDFTGGARPAVATDWDIGAFEVRSGDAAAPAVPKNPRVVVP